MNNSSQSARVKIDQPIVSYETVKYSDPAISSNVAYTTLNENISRPDELIGATYKIKTPLSEHALYVTINDIVLDAGSLNERRCPFEVFINSKQMDNFQWIVALTRILSAVFRKGGDVAFLVEELRSVFDPKGGYWKPGGRYMNSVVAEIGDVLARHLIDIGLLGAGSEATNSFR